MQSKHITRSYFLFALFGNFSLRPILRSFYWCFIFRYYRPNWMPVWHSAFNVMQTYWMKSRAQKNKNKSTIPQKRLQTPLFERKKNRTEGFILVSKVYHHWCRQKLDIFSKLFSFNNWTLKISNFELDSILIEAVHKCGMGTALLENKLDRKKINQKIA